MKQPPRKYSQSLFSRHLLFLSVMQGLFSLLVVAVVFKIGINLGQAQSEARALAFTTLIVSNLCLILTNRSWSKSIISMFTVVNKSLLFVIIGAVSFLAIVLYTPILRQLFYFEQLHAIDVVIALSSGILSVIWFELAKVISSKSGISLMR